MKLFCAKHCFFSVWTKFFYYLSWIEYRKSKLTRKIAILYKKTSDLLEGTLPTKFAVIGHPKQTLMEAAERYYWILKDILACNKALSDHCLHCIALEEGWLGDKFVICILTLKFNWKIPEDKNDIKNLLKRIIDVSL